MSPWKRVVMLWLGRQDTAGQSEREVAAHPFPDVETEARSLQGRAGSKAWLCPSVLLPSGVRCQVTGAGEPALLLQRRQSHGRWKRTRGRVMTVVFRTVDLGLPEEKAPGWGPAWRRVRTARREV